MMRYLLTLFLLFATPAMAGQVVVTIKPLHSLVAGVMEGSGMEPALLVGGKTSIHDFSLKPSQAKILRQADIVFYMGDNFELFLRKILPQLPESTQRVAMEKTPRLTLHPSRYSKDMTDLHAWASIGNAILMVDNIANILAKTYPEHAALFAANAKSMQQKLETLDGELKTRMTPLKTKPFAVFHDAIQYFTRSYHLNYIGAVTLHPEQAPSAAHMKELRAEIMEMKAQCVFREPEFDSRIVDNLMQGTGAKSAMLDPEGALLPPGKDLYFQLMDGIAASMETCLK